ncbi:MAG: radical SAM family heme chaperone HemW [Bacteroidia bacterium]
MGIYIHIPYCRRACVYCDFHFLTSLRGKAAMVQALAQELVLRSRDHAAALETLYLGGGTPSILAPDELARLFDTVRAHYALAPQIECTLEANPDDLTPPYLDQLLDLGVNRLSIGVQSFEQEDLLRMNRSHSAAQALACIDAARAAGFANLSIDLIFGLPARSPADWEANLRQAIDLAPAHLSVYALTVEPRTALAHQVRKGEMRIPPDETYEAQFLLAHDLLTAAGYEHYELSNYALPGYRSRHNSSYWSGQPYLGIGPSAHGYDGSDRYWNAAQHVPYTAALAVGSLPPGEREHLGPRERYHEYLMTGLRTADGVLLDRLRAYLPDWDTRHHTALGTWAAQGWIHLDETRLRLSPRGWLVSDHLIAQLFDAD